MMKVEIWSDVMCPFCYIGKRRFEEALEQFEHKDEVEIEWKSFQLNPDMKTDPTININQYLADAKGWTLDYAEQMNNHVTQMAAEVGLSYDFDKAVVANSFKAHRFSHLAKKRGLGDKAEEALFNGYFTQGLNIDDNETLLKLGAAIGLDAAEVQQVLESDTYADAVKHDIAEAQYLGIRGVPFFVMNNKYGVSGAQAVPVFQETIEKSFAEWQQENNKPKLTIIEGESCTPDGDCG
ncbi:DsbA family oxidoreductase [Mucilaginibacter flavus]|uniref:DsbA family oxidoreductase n=1 Tax=Mucilaginibacter flavus TaxID=931504 RepID=UPI0025B452D3|nr:DsbA family oxidoreductase [Mucilaginibacter flavus]MDN3580965.1 DsbA family oxidoreductase [Mucilaginibacter flavus]